MGKSPSFPAFCTPGSYFDNEMKKHRLSPYYTLLHQVFPTQVPLLARNVRARRSTR